MAETPVETLIANMRENICPKCPVALLCYSNRELPGYWCESCMGWYLYKLRLLVQCTEFQSADDKWSLHQIPSEWSRENPCCISRRQNTLEIIGGLILKDRP